MTRTKKRSAGDADIILGGSKRWGEEAKSWCRIEGSVVGTDQKEERRGGTGRRRG